MSSSSAFKAFVAVRTHAAERGAVPASPSAAAPSVASTFASALRLKRHCTKLAAKLGPATPPEAFLFRGNAYMEMGMPYFAMADYDNASKVLNLSGQHQERCSRAIEALPSTMVGDFASTDAHLDFLVNPFLGGGVRMTRDYDVQMHAGREGYVSSTASSTSAAAEGSSPMTSKSTDSDEDVPYTLNESEARAFLASEERQAASLMRGRRVVADRDLPTGAMVMRAHSPFAQYTLSPNHCSNCARPLPPRLVPCTNEQCHEEYCDRRCRADAIAEYHGHVCRNREFQSVELELGGRLEGRLDEGEALVTVKGTSAYNDTAAILLTMKIIGACMQRGAIPSAVPELRTLGGKLEFDPKSMAGPSYDVYKKIEQAGRFSTNIPFEEFVSVLAKVRANCFTTEHSIALYVPRSMFNHSCNANVAEDADSKDLVTTRPVKAGEELCINYYPHLKDLPFDERRSELEKRSFHCLCPKCVDRN